MSVKCAIGGPNDVGVSVPDIAVTQLDFLEALRVPANKGTAPVLASGRAIGEATVTGVARFVATAEDLEAFQPGEILLAEFTLPAWGPVIETAAAIVTNRGGKTSHAAIAARKLGLPAVVGALDGASRLWTGAVLTICCEQDGVGRVYEGVSASTAATCWP